MKPRPPLPARSRKQTATTSEMGRNLAEAARRTSEISDIVNEAASAAQSTSTGASYAEDAAAELSTMAQELKNLLGQFRY